MSIISAFPGGGAAKYIHSKTGTAHSFTGAGKLGFAILTADYADGDSISVNGTAMTVVGDESALRTDGNVLFSVDGSTMYLYEVADPFVIPDGQTITPVNDVETWLACAGVRYEVVNSPNLATAVASESLMTTLVNSQNAVDYMARSTTIQTAVLGSATAIAALDASTPFLSALMTSNSAPTGYSASHVGNGNTPAWYCWGSAASQWYAQTGEQPSSSVGSYSQICLPTAIWPYKFYFVTGNGTLRLTGSADGQNWVTLIASFNASGTLTLTGTTAVKMRYFRVTVLTLTGANSVIAKSCRIYGKE